MPERPKRRKNNKNKRKNNKNVRAEVIDNSPSPSVVVPLRDEFPLESVEDKHVNKNSEVEREPINAVLENNKELNTGNNNVVISEQKIFDNEKSNCEEPVNNYVVESPDQSTKNKTKLSNGMKSKSVDNDDSPTIVEITDETDEETNIGNTLPFIDGNNVIISDVESDVQWQNVDVLIDLKDSTGENLMKGASAITTLPLNVALCNQTKSLSPEDEDSLRCYLKTLNLSTNPEGLTASEINSEIEQVINREIKHRLRKKALVEDAFYQRAGPSRSLAVIDEEGSSESSMTSRRQSYLSDKRSDNDELEDEVFESKTTQFTKKTYDNSKKLNFSSRTIPQKCIRVDAKLKEPEVSEARGNWTTKTIEKLSGAEIVYLTDSSSSTSSIYDVNDDTENGEESEMSVRIITPTIEVIDTEKMLENTFISKPDNGSHDKDANTDVLLLDTESIPEIRSDTKEIESSSFHEIIVDSTENIKTNLIVKDITIDKNENYENKGIIEDKVTESKNLPKDIDEYDLKIKVLKCELNNAFNNLITEVTSDSENTKESMNDLLSRQDSSSSVSSSQCTAKYNPTHSSLNDVANIMQDNHDESGVLSSHVKEVLDHVPENTSQVISTSIKSQPLSMRDLCLRRISLLPFGDKIIEELAQVSKRLQNLTSFGTDSYLNIKDNRKLSINSEHKYSDNSKKIVKENVYLPHPQNHSVPPPVKPRKSSLKKSQEEHSPSTQSNTENICPSPSQKILIGKTNTVVTKDEESLVHNFNNENIKHKKSDTISAGNIKNINSSPFKSQTGSRLLSLICDTSLKNNLNSVLTKSFNKDLNELPEDRHPPRFLNRETKIGYPSYKKSTVSPSTFTSIPPPKPRLFSSSFYESDSTSEYTEKSHKAMQNERKYFHFSTGNLSKDIEDDVSSIQNMHRYYTNLRDAHSHEIRPRRPSLPKDLCDQQMEYIRQKEQEVDAEIRRLEQEKPINITKKGPRAPMIPEKDTFLESTTSYYNSQTSKGEYLPTKPAKFKNSLFSSSEEELLREKMYSEYVNQMAEREFRREQKIIKITKPSTSRETSRSMPMIDILNSKVNNRIEREFITKARERWDKLGIRDPETVDERNLCCDVYSEPKVIEHKIKVLEAGEEKDVTNLPNHLQEFVQFTVKEKDQEIGGTGESEPEKPSAHVVVLCAVIILMMTVGKYFLRLFQNK